MFARVENGVTIFLPKNKKNAKITSEAAVSNGNGEFKITFFWPRKNQLFGGGGITSKLASQ